MDKQVVQARTYGQGTGNRRDFYFFIGVFLWGGVIGGLSKVHTSANCANVNKREVALGLHKI